MEIYSKIYKNNNLYWLAKSRAIAVRQKYGLESGPIRQPVFSFLERENCFVVTIDLGKTSATGMYLRKDDNKLVLIHKKRVLGQQNFTAAHELSHVLFDEDSLMDICYPEHYQKKDTKEILADFFAANFLMPEEDIITDCENLKYINKKNIVLLSAKYQVSFIAMALRLYTLGFITREDFDKYKKQSTKGKIGARKICEDEGIDPAPFIAPLQSYISPSFFELLVNVYHKANISRSVFIDYYLKPLEEELQLSLQHIVEKADREYPTEMEWDDI
ncbi:hypothetical protein H839_08404 [Parageobacillus genomosp. 1]|uniref:IrrE N-terminal-like domain-containing protein n=1 Tax=Parageobacillus genomosp. 1 TaxID=1295642 RepID=A0ABC9VGB1_9BACL|nr:ImmA/IrrE family metallo-endopeptidase [Parageobacillus genomosp. 1]EZP74993.1 hypothetical protein H839_15873 [Parageobacillus genomosp. 1]EZP77640.1 hypothetical protein H839_08404 [Parageobacillus genomosp. 1]